MLILPVFLFLIFAVYDFGMIFNKKNALENMSTDIINLYKDGSSIDEIRNLYDGIDITVSEENDFNKITASLKVKLITPGFNRIFGNPYEINVERYIKNEQ